MQIILSSNIEIIEGNQNNFFFGYTPHQKKNPTKRMRHGNVSKLTY